MSEHNAKKFTNYTFAILEKPDEVFIGLFGLKLGGIKHKRAEIWYKIHPKYWSQGYATETLKAVIQFAFDKLHLHRIEAGCAVNNFGSMKVLEKAGMR